MSVSKRKPTTWAEHPYYRIAAVEPEVACAIIANPGDWEWVVSSPSPVEIVEQGTADTVEHAQAAADAAARRVIEDVIARMHKALEVMGAAVTSNVTHVDGCVGVHGYEEQPEGDPCPACGVGGSEVRP